MNTNYYSLLFFCSLLCACGNQPQQEEVITADTAPEKIVDSSQTPVNELTDFKFHLYISNIPSPFEGINDLSKAEFGFKN